MAYGQNAPSCDPLMWLNHSAVTGSSFCWHVQFPIIFCIGISLILIQDDSDYDPDLLMVFI